MVWRNQAMAKNCPVYGRKVLYTECLECDNKQECKKRETNNQGIEEMHNHVMKRFTKVN